MDVPRSTISGGAWTRRQNGQNRRKTPCKTATAKNGATVHPSGGGLKPLTETENTLGLEFGFTALSLLHIPIFSFLICQAEIPRTNFNLFYYCVNTGCNAQQNT